MILTLNVIPRRAGNELEIIVLASAMRSNFFTGSTLDRCEPPDVCDSVYEGGTLILGLAATSLNCAAIENLLGGEGSRTLFRRRSSEGVRRYPARGDSRASGKAWIALDGAGCYHFCYHNSRLWPVSGNDQIRNILPRVSGITQVSSVGSLRKKQT